MATQDTEVNKVSDESDLDEVLTLDDLPNPDSKDIGDAIVEDPENAPTEEEKETPDAPSTENKPADDEEEGEPEKVSAPAEVVGGEALETDEVSKKPKDVAGETPREKALRKEVERVKSTLRKERGIKLFNDIPQTAAGEELSAEDKEILSQFDPEQVANMEKLLAVQAKKMGFVKKDEFRKEQTVSQLQDSLESWLSSHPELDEKNDPDGLLWKQVQAEYGRYVPPKNSTDLVKILDRVHKDIFGIETDPKALRQVEAKQEKIKVASHSATTGPSKSSDSNVIDASTKQLVDSGAMKGWDDETLKELGLK